MRTHTATRLYEEIGDRTFTVDDVRKVLGQSYVRALLFQLYNAGKQQEVKDRARHNPLDEQTMKRIRH